jgi:hypothetical protein
MNEVDHLNRLPCSDNRQSVASRIVPATGFTEEKSYLCAINEVYECVAVTGCSRISIDDANLVGVMIIDMEKKQLRTAPLGGEHRADDIQCGGDR